MKPANEEVKEKQMRKCERPLFFVGGRVHEMPIVTFQTVEFIWFINDGIDFFKETQQIDEERIVLISINQGKSVFFQ